MNDATQAAFPNAGKSRYRAVHALLLYWTDDDLLVIKEVKGLRTVLKKLCGFEAEQWSIPSSDSHAELQDKLRAFTKTHSKEDTLLIVYYGGHGYLDNYRQPVWLCNQQPGAASLKWYAHQVSLEDTKSDVLILLDCCHAGGSSGDAAKGTKEVIAACGFETWAPGVGDHSFTKSLIEELKYLSTGSSFSASSLHHRILDRLKHWSPIYNAERLSVQDPEGRFRDAERRKCPVYISLNKETMRRSIEIVSRVMSTPKGQASGSNSIYTPNKTPVDSMMTFLDDERFRHTEVTISVQVERGQILHHRHLIDWIREIPLLAKSVKLQAVIDSYSTLVLLSLPVAVWNVLPDDLACSFVGYTTSWNHLLPTSNNLNQPKIDLYPLNELGVFSAVDGLSESVSSGYGSFLLNSKDRAEPHRVEHAKILYPHGTRQGKVPASFQKAKEVTQPAVFNPFDPSRLLALFLTDHSLIEKGLFKQIQYKTSKVFVVGKVFSIFIRADSR